MMDRRLLKEARTARGLLIAAALLSGLTGVVIALQARLLSQIITRAYLERAALEALGGTVALLAGVILLRALLAWAGTTAAALAGVKVRSRLRERLLGHLVVLGPAYTGGERSGELALAVTEGVDALDSFFREYLPALAGALLVPLILLLAVFPLDPLTFIVLLITGPLIPLFMWLIGRAAGSVARRQYAELSRLGAHFLDVMQGLPTLRLFNRSEQQAATIARVTDQFRRATMGVLRVAFLSALTLEMLATLSVAVVAVEIGLRLLSGGIDLETALFLLVVAPEFYLPLRTLGARFHTAAESAAAARRIEALLEEPLPPAPASIEPIPADLTIRLEAVSVRYAGAQEPALDGLTLELRPGEQVALVGESGAGKSTVAALLLAFRRPDAGRITVGGVDLDRLDPRDWRRRVAWVPQRPYLFSASIADNIRLGRPEAPLEAVIAAARAAGAHDFISALPHGYQTLLGERGLNLSGGQAQRIAIARAFLKDAPILILDEVTASLDPAAEAQVLEALERLLAGRTALIIAHRLNTVAQASCLVILRGGRVVESGTYAGLMAREGAFRELVEASSAPVLRSSSPWTAREQDSLPALPLSDPAGRGVSALQVMGRLLGYARPFWKGMTLAALLGTLTIAASLGLLMTSAWMISTAAVVTSIADLGVAAVGVRFFGIARGGLRYLERLVAHETTFRLLAGLRVAFYRGLEPLAPARLTRFQSGDLLGRAVGDIEALENLYLRVIAPPLVAALSGGLAVLLFAAIHRAAGLALLGCLLAAGVGIPLLAWALGRGPGQKLVGARAAFSGAVVESLQGMADLIAFGQEDGRRAALRDWTVRIARAERRFGWLDGLQGAANLLAANGAALLVLLIAIPRVEGVFLSALALGTLAVFEVIGPLATAAGQLGVTLEAGRRLFALLDEEPAVRDPQQPAPLPERFDLEIEGLRFGYDPARPVLDGLTLRAPAGARIAILGESGAGKSTLVELLVRFREYQGGSIRLGGRELRDFRGADVRRVIAVMSQRTYLFNTSVRENIRIARAEAADAEIEAAARRAQAHEFIMALPDGYATLVGEDGARLSGGERQRIALARALLKDAPILILDEATANLDALTERAIAQTIAQAAAGRTVLICGHRGALLELADAVVALRPP